MLVHNRAEVLQAAIDSVLAQVGVSLELLIVDDGSTDESGVVAAAAAERDPRVVVLPSRRCGIPASRNRAVAVARGRFLAICDSDDLSRRDRFATQVDAMQQDPGLGGVGSRFSRFERDPADGVVPDWHWGLRDGRGPFAFPTAMLRTAAVRDVGAFDESFALVEDLDLCYRLAGQGWRFAICPEVLVDYRVNGQGISDGHPDLYRYALRAQLRGVRAFRGRFTPAGYLRIAQSALRAGRDSYRSRFSTATAK